MYYGRNYGWCYRYRKKRKTLCTLFPETGAFTVLVTLGKKETEEVASKIESFSPETQRIFNEARIFHDGKWIFRRVLDEEDLADVISLITVKSRPG